MSPPLKALLGVSVVIALILAIALTRPGADRLAHQGDINLKAGFAEIALSDYQAALTIDPDHLSATMGQAAALLTMGRYHEAEHAYGRILDTDPTDDVRGIALANRGIARDRQGKTALAIIDYESSLEFIEEKDNLTQAIDRISGSPSLPSISDRLLQLKSSSSSIPSVSQR